MAEFDPKRDEKVAEELKQIRITEIGDCPRKLYYRLYGFPASKPHFTSIRGTIVHSQAEQLITEGDLIDLSKDALLRDKALECDERTFELALSEANQIYVPQIKRWLSKTSLLEGEQPRLHQRISLNYKDFIVTGEIDCYTSKALIEFKTGRYSYAMLKKHALQLAGYEWLLNRAEDRYIARDWYVIYLKELREQEVPKHLAAEMRKEFEKLLKEEIKVRKEILEGKSMGECKLSFRCVYCKYRGICPGI